MPVAVTLGLLALWSRRWPGGSVRRRRLGSVPFLLDLAEVPDGQGSGPGEHEHADDHEAGFVDVEVARERPEPAAQPVFLLDEAEDFDGADEEGDEHRQAGDGQVVVDLPDGPQGASTRRASGPRNRFIRPRLASCSSSSLSSKAPLRIS